MAEEERPIWEDFTPADIVPDAPSNVCPRCSRPIDEHFWDRIEGIDVATCRNGLPLNPPKLDRPPWKEPDA